MKLLIFAYVLVALALIALLWYMIADDKPNWGWVLFALCLTGVSYTENTKD